MMTQCTFLNAQTYYFSALSLLRILFEVQVRTLNRTWTGPWSGPRTVQKRSGPGPRVGRKFGPGPVQGPAKFAWTGPGPDRGNYTPYTLIPHSQHNRKPPSLHHKPILQLVNPFLWIIPFFKLHFQSLHQQRNDRSELRQCQILACTIRRTIRKWNECGQVQNFFFLLILA